MQKVNFPIEFIIADDCSTDGTLAICKSYAERYPELICIIAAESNVGSVLNEQRAFMAARGKYIATCEGDDYWTDPNKLQKQVDFMESHPDFSVCFHRFRRLHLKDGNWGSDHCDNLFPDSTVDGIEISMHQFMHQWVTQYLTMVFRKDCYDFDAYRRYKYYRDTHQIYHLIRNGRCWLFAFEGGVYQMTEDGIYSTKSAFLKEDMTLTVDRELWKINGDKRWREMCGIVMQHMVDVFYDEKGLRPKLIGYSMALPFYGTRLRKTLKNIWKIIF